MRTVPQAAAQDSDQSFLGSVRLHFSKFRLAAGAMKILSLRSYLDKVIETFKFYNKGL